jgi:hypothetical protein
MSRYRLHKKQLPLYPVNLVFSANGSKLQGYFNSEYEEEETSGGFTKIAFVDDVFTVGIFLKAKDHRVGLSNIAHECFHVVNRICGYLGIETGATNDEAGAYIMSWVYDWLLDALKKDYNLEQKKEAAKLKTA